MKKYICILTIIAILVVNLYIPIGARETYSISSLPRATKVYSLENYFGSIRIDADTYNVTVDGKPTSLRKALDITKKKSDKLKNSNKRLRRFCRNNNYTIEKRDGDFVISNPYQTKRILVYTEALTDTYGATTSYHNCGAYTLEYDTEEDTILAYNNLLKDYSTKQVMLDTVINVNSAWQDQYANYDFYQSFPNIRTNMYPLIQKINDYEGSKNELVVGVLDSGYDSDASVFQNRFIDDKCVGFVSEEDLEKGSAEDLHGHGTTVSFALANCSPDNVKMIAYKIFDSTGNTSVSVVREALLQAYRDGVDIINMSFGGESYGTSWNFELKFLYNSGITMIASSGNEGSETVNSVYPASSTYTIAVSSIGNSMANDKYALSYFSTYGSAVTFSAPGEQLCLLKNDGKMYFCDGTSYSAPVLTGQLATVRTLIDTSSVSEDIDLLKHFISSDFDSDYQLDSNYRSKEYGYGYLDFSNVTICDCGKEYCHVLYHDGGEIETTTSEDIMKETTTSEPVSDVVTTSEFASNESPTDITSTSYIDSSETITGLISTIPNTEVVSSETSTNDTDNTDSSTNFLATTVITSETTYVENEPTINTTVQLPKKIRLKKKKKSVTIKYKKQNKKDKIIIYYSKTKDFQKYTTITTKKQRMKFQLKKKGFYFIKLRSFRKINGKKYYSSYSKIKRFKIS